LKRLSRKLNCLGNLQALSTEIASIVRLKFDISQSDRLAPNKQTVYKVPATSTLLILAHRNLSCRTRLGNASIRSSPSRKENLPLFPLVNPYELFITVISQIAEREEFCLLSALLLSSPSASSRSFPGFLGLPGCYRRVPPACPRNAPFVTDTTSTIDSAAALVLRTAADLQEHSLSRRPTCS
jgi:hypothetical protein